MLEIEGDIKAMLEHGMERMGSRIFTDHALVRGRTAPESQATPKFIFLVDKQNNNNGTSIEFRREPSYSANKA